MNSTGQTVDSSSDKFDSESILTKPQGIETKRTKLREDFLNLSFRDRLESLPSLVSENRQVSMTEVLNLRTILPWWEVELKKNPVTPTHFLGNAIDYFERTELVALK